MGKNARIKRERREAKQKIKAEQAAVKHRIENTDISNMTDDGIRKFIINELKNPMSFDYFVGSAMAKNDHAMLDVLNDFKLYGTLPDVAIQRDKDGKVIDVETTKPAPKLTPIQTEELPAQQQEVK